MLLACLLALLTASGSALPSPVLWQCHHATQVVPASLAARSSAMPCDMGGHPMPMAGMACCAGSRLTLTKKTDSTGAQALGRPACHPTYTALASSASAQGVGRRTEMGQRLALLPALNLTTSPLWPAPITVTLRQRPPPDGLFRSDSLARPRLRAPPAV